MPERSPVMARAFRVPGRGRHEQDPTLRLHRLRPALTPREIYLLWPAGRSHSPLAARAIRIAAEVAGRIAKRTPR
jgi:hypothetical protein